MITFIMFIHIYSGFASIQHEVDRFFVVDNYTSMKKCTDSVPAITKSLNKLYIDNDQISTDCVGIKK